MSHHGENHSGHDGIFEQRNNFFLAPSPTMRGALVFLLLAGAVTFGAGMAMGLQTRAWASYIFNLWFFFAISLGGIAFSAMQDVLGAKWGRSIMRLHESFSSFLPLATALMVILFACIRFDLLKANEVYSWIKDPSSIEHFWGKRFWLQENFMLIRDTLAMVAILFLAGWQLKHKLGRDRSMLGGNAKVLETTAIDSRNALRYWSGPILVCYAVLFSLLAFDLLMSLAPTWFSTLWGGWAFAVMMQTLFASTLIIMYVVKHSAIGQYIGQQQFHDVGKLLHGFTIFFAYLTYAHILTYWYGNIPEETEYFIRRLEAPWIYIVIGAPIMSFAIPLFALIPKPAKWTAIFTIPIACLILFAQWLTMLLLVMPEVVEAKSWGLPWLEVGTFFGFLGLFLLCVIKFGQKNPMVSIADPLLREALAEAHH